MKPKPKTAWIEIGLYGEVMFYPDKPMAETVHVGEMLGNDFLAIFGWIPGKTPVEVRLDRVHRRKARKVRGQFKPDRKPKRKARR